MATWGSTWGELWGAGVITSTAAELRQHDYCECAYLLVIEGLPYMWVTDHHNDGGGTIRLPVVIDHDDWSEPYVEVETTTIIATGGTDAGAVVNFSMTDDQDPVEVGSEVIYRFRTTNHGNHTARDLRLTCELPRGLEFVRGEGASLLPRGSRTVPFVPFSELVSGASANWSLTARAVAEGVQTVSAKLTSPEFMEARVATATTRVYE